MLKKDLFLSPKLLGMLPGCHGGSRKCLGMLPGCHGSSRKCLGMLPGCHGNSRKYLGMLPGCHGSSRKNLGMLPGSFFADSPSGRVLPYGRWTHASMKSHLPPFGGRAGEGLAGFVGSDSLRPPGVFPREHGFERHFGGFLLRQLAAPGGTLRRVGAGARVVILGVAGRLLVAGLAPVVPSLGDDVAAQLAVHEERVGIRSPRTAQADALHGGGRPSGGSG